MPVVSRSTIVRAIPIGIDPRDSSAADGHGWSAGGPRAKSEGKNLSLQRCSSLKGLPSRRKQREDDRAACRRKATATPGSRSMPRSAMGLICERKVFYAKKNLGTWKRSHLQIYHNGYVDPAVLAGTVPATCDAPLLRICINEGAEKTSSTPKMEMTISAVYGANPTSENGNSRQAEDEQNIQ